MEPQDRMSDTATYVYDPLPNDRAIRLIQIFPDNTLAHGFSLLVRSFTLKDAPAFCCLSYTWQSAKVSSPRDYEYDNEEVADTFAVNCGGYTLAVNGNLFDLLCRACEESWFMPNSIAQGC